LENRFSYVFATYFPTELDIKYFDLELPYHDATYEKVTVENNDILPLA
jgi:hypothetical protein